MRLHGGTVDQHLGRRPAHARQRMEQVNPDALGSPANEPVVKRLSWPVDGRRINPAPTRLQHVDDAADHPEVVHPRLAARVRGQVRRDLRELLVRQPELIHLLLLQEP